MFSITFASFSALMLYAAYIDVRTYTLPDFISVILIAGFVLVAFAIQPPLSVIAWHIAISVIFFLFGFLFFTTGQFGGGDVKVITALGLWLGPNNAFAFFTFMSLFGGAAALFLIAFRFLPLPDFLKKNPSIAALHDKGNGIPYGVAISIAALIEFPNTAIYDALAQL